MLEHPVSYYSIAHKPPSSIYKAVIDTLGLPERNKTSNCVILVAEAIVFLIVINGCDA